MAARSPIRLADPNPARTNIFFPGLSAADIQFKPAGLMILFPSCVPHAVPPHSGERERISIGRVPGGGVGAVGK
jgi:hypothetical protein